VQVIKKKSTHCVNIRNPYQIMKHDIFDIHVNAWNTDQHACTSTCILSLKGIFNVNSRINVIKLCEIDLLTTRAQWICSIFIVTCVK